MSLRPCAIVPCYNHGATVGGVVSRLRAQGLPVIVVDDGSHAPTKEALEKVRAEGLHLFSLERNEGKGAAMVRGFREAGRLGFTHALQVDADGQHRVEDAARFLERARARPDALICGMPEYDADAPASRVYGRWLTHLWVWIETLSLDIGDSMCGFRLYPLGPTLDLLERVDLAPRMSFDIDIAVRLYWEGLPVENVRTRVAYPAGGLSHFDMVRDNARISATHARLFLGMLARLPRLLARRFGAPRRHWSRVEERGAPWGLRLVAGAQRSLGRPAARIALAPAVIWFFLTGAQARAASRRYLARLGESGAAAPRPTAWNVLRHMMSFADSGLDKLAAWRGDVVHADVEFSGREEFARLRREGRGALFIGSHLGNLEMVRALAVTDGIAPITAVVYTDHARRFAAALRGASARFADNLMEVSDLGPQTAIAMRERVERGEILVIVGDRTPASENGRCSTAPFLGHPAPFPQGPVILAHLLGCPVYLFFCLKQAGRYRIHLERFAERLELPREGREAAIEGHVRRYAARLEWYCREAPLQWFNFFDFWHEPVGRS